MQLGQVRRAARPGALKRATLLLAVLIPASAVAADELGATPASSSTPGGRWGMGKHMKALGMMAKGKVDLPPPIGWPTPAPSRGCRALPSWFPAGAGPDASW